MNNEALNRLRVPAAWALLGAVAAHMLGGLVYIFGHGTGYDATIAANFDSVGTSMLHGPVLIGLLVAAVALVVTAQPRTSVNFPVVLIAMIMTGFAGLMGLIGVVMGFLDAGDSGELADGFATLLSVGGQLAVIAFAFLAMLRVFGDQALVPRSAPQQGMPVGQPGFPPPQTGGQQPFAPQTGAQQSFAQPGYPTGGQAAYQQPQQLQPQQQDWSAQPAYGSAPAQPGVYDPNQAGVYDPNQAAGYAVNQPGAYDPNQAGVYDPNQAGVYDPNQAAGYAANQPGAYDPNQPGAYDPNQPGAYDPNQAAGYAPNQPGAYDPNQSGTYAADPAAGQGYAAQEPVAQSPYGTDPAQQPAYGAGSGGQQPYAQSWGQQPGEAYPQSGAGQEAYQAGYPQSGAHSPYGQDWQQQSYGQPYQPGYDAYAQQGYGTGTGGQQAYGTGTGAQSGYGTGTGGQPSYGTGAGTGGQSAFGSPYDPAQYAPQPGSEGEKAAQDAIQYGWYQQPAEQPEAPAEPRRDTPLDPFFSEDSGGNDQTQTLDPYPGPAPYGQQHGEGADVPQSWYRDDDRR